MVFERAFGGKSTSTGTGSVPCFDTSSWFITNGLSSR